MIAKLLGHQGSVERKTQFGAVDVLVVLTAAAVAFGLAVRIGVGGNEPLWLDETFTGAIAASGSFREVAHQAYEDVNAPLYYFLAHAWSLVAGLSNQALRFPSVAIGCVTPFLCLLPSPGLSRRARLAWCAVVAVWAPGLSFSQEARCYALLLALSIGATNCFIRLLDRPSVRRASIWAVVGCLAILTHYHALFLIGIQGLVYVVTCRRRALSTAPAVLAFAPAFLWLAHHSARIAEFAAPNIAWYRSLTADNVLELVTYASGSLAAPLLLLGLALLTFAVRLTRGGAAVAVDPAASSISRQHAWIAVFCSVTAALVVLLMAVVRPSLVPRYMIPFVPGILLGAVLYCERSREIWRSATNVLIVLVALGAVFTTWGRSDNDKNYNFQSASDYLMAAKTADLVFFWDHPATIIEDPSQLAIVGGFFFKRKNIDVRVIPVKIARHTDPNNAVLALATATHASILWLYDTNIHDTAAKEFPPRLQSPGTGLSCRDFGGRPIGIVACVPTEKRS